MVEGGEVLQGRPVAELILVLGLHHGRPLGPQGPHRLEDVHHPLVLHPLQHDGEAGEDPGPSHPGTEDKKWWRLGGWRSWYAQVDKLSQSKNDKNFDKKWRPKLCFMFVY